jgi:hypothetical protein
MNGVYIHHIPWSLRVRIPALQANAQAAQDIQATMLKSGRRNLGRDQPPDRQRSNLL